MPEDDATLLRRYAEEKSEAAFAELVRRHLDLVYSVALRQTNGDAALAQDVAQTVFTVLARKARELASRPVLGGWLFRTTQFAAIDAVRAESRRRTRETEAHTMQTLHLDDSAPADWERLRPALDRVIGELRDDDRDAVVLRFFENKSFAEVGARLRLTENAARMRVERALEKMHALLARRGVTSTSAALGLALAQQAGVAAPAGLAASVTGAALASGAATTGAGAWAIFMSMSKLQVGIAGALVVAGTTGFVWQASATSKLRTELENLRQRNLASAALSADNLRLARAAAEAEAARAQGAESERLRAEAAALRARLAAVVAAKTETAPRTEAPFTGAAFEPSQVELQAKPSFQARPVYPAELRKLGVGGRATVDFIVDAQGRVRNATVLETTHPAIAEAALEAVRQWEFEPAKKDGQAVALHLTEPFVFKMAEGTKSTGAAQTSADKKPQRTAVVPWF